MSAVHVISALYWHGIYYDNCSFYVYVQGGTKSLAMHFVISDFCVYHTEQSVAVACVSCH